MEYEGKLATVSGKDVVVGDIILIGQNMCTITHIDVYNDIYYNLRFKYTYNNVYDNMLIKEYGLHNKRDIFWKFQPSVPKAYKIDYVKYIKYDIREIKESDITPTYMPDGKICIYRRPYYPTMKSAIEALEGSYKSDLQQLSRERLRLYDIGNFMEENRPFVKFSKYL